jgi:hypothetical protein
MNLSPSLINDQKIENLFSLNITQKNTSTKIIMQLHRNEVNTSHLPFIVDLLKMNLPNVLVTKCFNDDNLPFREEVRNTEIGHLFEHILLEYLCQLKIAKGSSRASYAGRTRWNWIKDPRGKFHIHLNCGLKDADILPIAVEKTVTLMKFILLEEQQAMFPVYKIPGAQLRLTQKNGVKNGKRVKP